MTQWMKRTAAAVWMLGGLGFTGCDQPVSDGSPAGTVSSGSSVAVEPLGPEELGIELPEIEGSETEDLLPEGAESSPEAGAKLAQ